MTMPPAETERLSSVLRRLLFARFACATLTIALFIGAAVVDTGGRWILFAVALVAAMILAGLSWTSTVLRFRSLRAARSQPAAPSAARYRAGSLRLAVYGASLLFGGIVLFVVGFTIGGPLQLVGILAGSFCAVGALSALVVAAVVFKRSKRVSPPDPS